MTPASLLNALAVFFLAVLAVMLAVPFLYPAGTFVHLDGSPFIIDRDWSSYGLGGLVYQLGDVLCHQEYARSFILNGSQMPVCIRDTGLLIGFAVGLFTCGYLKERIYQMRLLLIGFGLMVLSVLEFLIEHGFDVDLPEARFVIGIASGIGASIVVAWALHRSYDLG